MARTSTYLNFMGNTEEAFNFYRAVFGTEFEGEIDRMGGAPANPDAPPLSDAEKNLVLHIALPIIGGHVLMGTDILESAGHTLKPGNNISIMLEPDTRAETERLFSALAVGGSVDMPLTQMFWGDYFGSLTDKFGIPWMFNCSSEA
jgi:PhnB protein